jgi:flagellum-specific ATP synthase
VDRAVQTPERHALAVAARRLLAAHRDVRELVEVGAYARGSDPVADLAITLKPQLDAFLRQAPGESADPEDTWARLAAIVPADVPGGTS